MKFYTCPMCCNSGFTNQQDLKEHLLKASNPINCPACFKSCKNVIYLIKHLDQCAASKQESEQSSYNRSKNLNDRSQNSVLDDDEDDVEGYFCTVCDIKIPDVYKHIQQFHTGQEVILQDDDDDEGEILDPAQFFNSENSHDQKPSLSKREYKRKATEEFNGDGSGNHKNKKTQKKYKSEDISGEALYCIKCDISFPSLNDHMKNYHDNYDVVVKEVSITQLFPESQTTNGSLAYNCSCCRKSFVRKNTLMKHLKLHVCEEKLKGKKNCCQKKSEEKLKKFENFDSNLSGSGTNSGTEYEKENSNENENETETGNKSIVKTETEDDDKFGVSNTEKTEDYELEGFNHLFDT